MPIFPRIDAGRLPRAHTGSSARRAQLRLFGAMMKLPRQAHAECIGFYRIGADNSVRVPSEIRKADDSAIEAAFSRRCHQPISQQLATGHQPKMKMPMLAKTTPGFINARRLASTTISLFLLAAFISLLAHSRSLKHFMPCISATPSFNYFDRTPAELKYSDKKYSQQLVSYLLWQDFISRSSGEFAFRK